MADGTTTDHRIAHRDRVLLRALSRTRLETGIADPFIVRATSAFTVARQQHGYLELQLKAQ